MFQRIIDDFKERTGAALRLTSLAGLTLLALLITAAFLLAAGFIYVLQNMDRSRPAWLEPAFSSSSR